MLVLFPTFGIEILNNGWHNEDMDFFRSTLISVHHPTSRPPIMMFYIHLWNQRVILHVITIDYNTRLSNFYTRAFRSASLLVCGQVILNRVDLFFAQQQPIMTEEGNPSGESLQKDFSALETSFKNLSKSQKGSENSINLDPVVSHALCKLLFFW